MRSNAFKYSTLRAWQRSNRIDYLIGEATRVGGNGSGLIATENDSGFNSRYPHDHIQIAGDTKPPPDFLLTLCRRTPSDMASPCGLHA